MKIALIAHDKKKNEIIELSKKYKDVLSQHELYATGTTGTLIMGGNRSYHSQNEKWSSWW